MTQINANSDNLPAVLDTEGLKNLPAKYQTFQLPTDSVLEIDSELAEMIEDQDKAGFQKPAPRQPFAAIRQKPLLNDNGNTIHPAGGFKIKHKDHPDIPDVDGELGLYVSIISDMTGRVWFEKLTDEQPKCKSIGGLVGIGLPGGQCKICELSQFKPDGKRPDCAQQINLLCWDHTIKALYVLNLGPSGLAPYDDFKRFMESQKVVVAGINYSLPVHYAIVRITATYKKDPAPHFIPRFTFLDTGETKVVSLMKSLRIDADVVLNTTVKEEDMTGPEFDADSEADKLADPGSELPEDVTPVKDGKIDGVPGPGGPTKNSMI